MPDPDPVVERAQRDETPVRRAEVSDAVTIAELLHAFNTEFDTETPGVEVLANRLRTLLGEPSTFAVLGGPPATGVALVTLRPNVWSDGPVALLDEMYVEPEHRGGGIGSAILQRMVEICCERGVAAIEINVDESDAAAMRFYERHGFSGTDPDSGERAFYYYRALEGEG
ncbi:GNAT family N-acetyltransferase [Microbacterium phyllosphaerae]|uniref:GNAT family N-acetyltransferase n=1 Tax=Microbacterium phyllosphaerae TaxID=124798 RepID=UPI002166DD7C|nr:GNAT family N-acetyltransferase [Microbacterium phyllosphaerae]MCS3442827.1 GNAT superfamily N-acetyltransferase [Microbacterium phyllosphaerae]